ncbi:chaperone CsaA [Alkalicoccus urumqiensis]|uniref:tRNA-binding protein n=1 Tax=Alkalicoccus urumqiensis TaxID=1548213 RepID=A0A2P6MHZ8_ALKUR|nr:chaperone CsaA [Alkalicoccus urumqiensis]PRO65915.1 tRNA-binding protein [Alkalicoccus urumqiensis]
MAQFEDFLKLDIRIGTVVEAWHLEKAKVPAVAMKIDFGPEIGILQSSAQITKRYSPEIMKGKQVTGIVNFPPRKIAGFSSEVLVIGGMPEEGDVVLVRPDEHVPDGTKIG